MTHRLFQAMSSLILPEVLDIVFAHVRDDDRSELCNYALVCYDWLVASRRSLLGSVVINRTTNYASFIENVVHRENMRPWLTSTRGMVYRQENQEDATGCRMVVELAGQLPNLRSLAVVRVDWSRLHHRAHLALSQHRHVQELVLSHCNFRSFGDLRRFLTALPSLTTLVLFDVVWESIAGQDSFPVLGRSSSQPALHTLHIELPSDDRSNAFLRWLAQTPTVSSLRRIALGSTHPDVNWHDFISTITSIDVMLDSASGELQ